MLPTNLEILNIVLASGSVACLVAAITFFYDHIFSKGRDFGKHIAPIAIPATIAITTLGTGISLLYSEVFGFVPCSLCWFQRIFLYPQVILSITSYKMGDLKMFPVYGIALSVCGFFASVYQYILQMLPRDSIPCPQDGAANCFDKVITEFGFVTFPLMSASIFLLLIALYLYALRDGKAHLN